MYRSPARVHLHMSQLRTSHTVVWTHPARKSRVGLAVPVEDWTHHHMQWSSYWYPQLFLLRFCTNQANHPGSKRNSTIPGRAGPTLAGLSLHFGQKRQWYCVKQWRSISPINIPDQYPRSISPIIIDETEQRNRKEHSVDMSIPSFQFTSQYSLMFHTR